jgi:hypothetical protein
LLLRNREAASKQESGCLIGYSIVSGIIFIKIPVRIGDHISVKPYEIDAILRSEVRPACTKDRIRDDEARRSYCMMSVERRKAFVRENSTLNKGIRRDRKRNSYRDNRHAQ